MNNVEVKTKGGLRFQSHRPIDESDPGFRILGHKLRWVSGGAQEDKMGRIWRVMRKSEMPPEFIKAMREANREMFGGDDTIRNRELVLAYAPDEAVDEHKKDLKEAAARQLSLVTSKAVPGGNKHMRVDEAEMSKVSSSEFFENT